MLLGKGLEWRGEERRRECKCNFLKGGWLLLTGGGGWGVVGGRTETTECIVVLD